ncbi:UDP-glucose/GDP-mannose dehydrogenase family protein [Planctomycetales bacterium ZRK34]|nr:UDP-glucose/GDP-mannose dehydrogenase family protein [Planctomycetales bacterium ZRK34]
MKLTMVGTGYVGLVTGTCLANIGNHVACLDVDQAKIDGLNHGQVPIYEPGLDELVIRNHKSGRLSFTTDITAAYQSAEAIFICVGTPSQADGHADLKYVMAAAEQIGKAIEAAPGQHGGLDPSDDDLPKIIVVKSTVPVGTNARVRAMIQSQTNKPFRMASNPEFLKEGAAINDFNKPDRVVIGAEDKQTGERLHELYETFVRQGNPIYVMDIPSAEMVKYASNCMLATKISFINEVAALCEAFGADIEQVRLGMCADKRIGNQFLYPGLGFGGSCFPKDVLASVNMGQVTITPADLLRAVYEVNQRTRYRFISKIDQHYESNYANRKFAIWGLAFKPRTDDMRQAPSVTIIEHLLDNRAEVVAYDPVASEAAQRTFGNRITYTDEAIDALDGVDALIICTEWDEFRHPDFDEMRNRMKHPVIFDGRNLYRPTQVVEQGFAYYSVGRRAIRPSAQPQT